MGDAIKLHSVNPTATGWILVFSSMDENAAVAVSLVNGNSQKATLERIQNAFDTFNRCRAEEAAAANG